MNYEFRSAGSPSRNGIVGFTSTLSSNNLSQTDNVQQGNVFKDLLSQSRSSISQKQQTAATKQDDVNQSRIDENPSVDRTPNPSTSQRKDVEEALSKAADQELVKNADDSVKEQNSDIDQVDSEQSLQNGLDAVAMINFKVPMELNAQGNPEVSESASGQSILSAISNEIAIQSQAQNPVGENLPLNQMLAESQSAGDDNFSMMVKQTAEAGLQMTQSGVVSTQLGESIEGKGLKENFSAIKPDGDVQQMAVGNPDGVITPNVSQDQNQELGVGAENGADQNIAQSTGSDSIVQSVVAGAEASKSEESTVDGNTSRDLGVSGLHNSNLAELNHIKGTEVPVKTEVVQQIEQKILQNYEINKPVVFQMTLSPDNLGDIDVQMQYSNGKLIIDIAAASQDTQNLLGKQIDQLVKSLNLQNVQVESVHLNKAVEAGNSSQNTSFSMNDNSDFSQQQNNGRLRESFLRNANIQQSLLQSSAEGSDDTIQGIAQSMYYSGQRRINYLV